jgi:hypothetical protein
VPRLHCVAHAAVLASGNVVQESFFPTSQSGLVEVTLFKVLRAHWAGRAPKRPYDDGLLKNLWIFFLAAKPYPYP